jgi:hypothetical protein
MKNNRLLGFGVLLVFGFVLVGCPNGSTNDEKTPEEKNTAERWGTWSADDTQATIQQSVDSDGVCTIIIGGTAEIDYENMWKVNSSYEYTGKVGASYTYAFEAWTLNDERTIRVQYFGGGDVNVAGPPHLGSVINITTTRTPYTIVGEDLPKGGVIPLEFQCANQVGTFYIKIVSISLNTTESYDGQVYNMDSTDREAVTSLPDGKILAKSDYSWNSTHDEDIDPNWWLPVGTITGNKITIDLPESVDDSFLRDANHSKFSADCKLGVLGPRKRFFLVKNFVHFQEEKIDWYTEEICILYLKTAQANYVIDHEEPELIIDLDAGWNFYIRTEDTVTKIDSLDAAYQDGFKWYLHDEANE